MTKVLVFESDHAFAGELRTELGRLGCTVNVVDDGNVGFRSQRKSGPISSCSSIELPRMNGFSVCNKLKKDALLKDVPLVIMSSESSEDTFEQHRKLRTRAEDYLHKPIAFSDLLSRIKNFVTISADGGYSDIAIEDDVELVEDGVEEELDVPASEPLAFLAPSLPAPPLPPSVAPPMPAAAVSSIPAPPKPAPSVAAPPPAPAPFPLTPPPSIARAAPQKSEKQADPEVDAFIGGAFDWLLGDEDDERAGARAAGCLRLRSARAFRRNRR